MMFYEVTRFSRKIIEGERLVEAAERGMRVWSLTGEYDLATADSSSPAGGSPVRVAARRLGSRLAARSGNGPGRSPASKAL